MKNKKKVGHHAKDLLDNPDTGQSLMDTSLEMTKRLIPSIEECIENHKSWKDPFYVIVINKRERLMVNVMRQYFTARKTLPTPDYDQSVFRYNPFLGDLKFLWALPDKNTIDYLIATANEVPAEQQQLLEFCILFKQNKLAEKYGE